MNSIANGNGTAAATAPTPTPPALSLAEFQEAARLSLAGETTATQPKGGNAPTATPAPAQAAQTQTQSTATATEPAKTGQGSPPVAGTTTTAKPGDAVKMPTPAEIQAGLQNLNLNAQTLDTIQKALTEGGEIDAAALGLSAEQTEALGNWIEKSYPQAEPGTSSQTEEEHDATPEEMAAMSASEKRIFGALKKERELRKQDKQEKAELRQRLEQLEAKTSQAQNQNTNQRAPTNGDANNPPGQPAPDAAMPLGDCTTFEQVDARAMQAAQTEAQVSRITGKLSRGGIEAAAAELRAAGITQIGGMPVAEYDAERLADFLDAALQGSKQIQAAAPARKQFLANVGGNWEATAKQVPELNDTASALYKGVVQLVQSVPWLKQMPNWPQVAVSQVLGQQAFTAKTKPAAGNDAAPVRPARVARPVLKAAPGASRRSTAAMPATSAQDALAAKINSGTATMAEVQQYAVSQINVR